MRFKGSAPEIINCRLAMLGFVAAVGAGNAHTKFCAMLCKTQLKKVCFDVSHQKTMEYFSM